MAEVVLNQDNFKTEVLDYKGVVLVDFWAVWCGPCKMLSPLVEEVAGEADGFKVGKVNVDEADDLARKYKVFSIPTLLVFKGGEPVQRSVGAIPKENILGLLK